ncbi:hypothetical protein QO003_002457 [Arthrobacter silviterrae]|nr:hypothetical protein [Arthrobacter silviterrae]
MNTAQHMDGALPAAARPADPVPGECLACYIRRRLHGGCHGHELLVRFTLRRPGLSLPANVRGSPCDCEIVRKIYEPFVFQIRADDGRGIPPRPLAEVRACPGVPSHSAGPCGLWAPTMVHAGPPWSWSVQSECHCRACRGP